MGCTVSLTFTQWGWCGVHSFINIYTMWHDEEDQGGAHCFFSNIYTMEHAVETGGGGGGKVSLHNVAC